MLITLAEIKDYLSISGTSDDTFLQSQISLFSQAISYYCRRNFEAANYVQKFYREDFDRNSLPIKDLYLAEYPLNSVAQVLIGTEVVDPSEYRFSSKYGKLTFVRGKEKYFGSYDMIQVEYNSGMTTIPDVLKDVCYSLISERYSKKKTGAQLSFGSDVQQVSIPGVMSISYDYTLSSNERSSSFGTLLGNHVNILDYFRSERQAIGPGRIEVVS